MESLLPLGFLCASKICLLGLAGISKCTEPSSFFKDLKAQTAEVGSFCNLHWPCRWDPFSGVLCGITFNSGTYKRSCQVRDPRSEMCAVTVLYVVGTVLLLKSKKCFWPYDFVFLNIKNYSWFLHVKFTCKFTCKK